MLPSIKEIEKIGKDVVEQSGQHVPQMMFELNGKVNIVLLEYNDNSKEKMLNDLRNYVQCKKIKTYYLIMEAWKSFNVTMRPRNAPDRQEILIINQFNNDLTMKGIIIDFTKDKDNKVVWGERCEYKNTDNYKTSWNFYLEKINITEKC